MLKNIEYLKNTTEELSKIKKIKIKAKLGIFSAFGSPEDIVELMKNFRDYQKDILNK